MFLPVLLLLHLLSALMAELDFCYDYNSTRVELYEMYFRSACEECECFGMDGEEDIGPCFEKEFSCPCDTRCCQMHCVSDSELLDPIDAYKSTALSSNFVTIITVSVTTLVIVMGLVFYLYRRRMTRYVRITRRLYMERSANQAAANQAKPADPELPPNYDDIALDSGPVPHLVRPPKYEDIAPSYSFAALRQHDQAGTVRAEASPVSPPPDIDS